MDIPTKCFAIVIGAGPNGLYALSKLCDSFPNETIIGIDKGEVCNNFYDYPNVTFHSTFEEIRFDNYIYDSLSLKDRPNTLELLNYYLSYKNDKNLPIYEEMEMTNITKNDDGTYNIKIKYDSRIISIMTKNVILATGMYETPNYLGIQEEKTNEKITHYCFDYNENNFTLIIVGNGNSAADSIIKLIASNKIHWIIRDNNLDIGQRIHSLINDKLRLVLEKYKENITIYYNSTVIDAFGDKLYFQSNDEYHLIEFDKCYLLTGYKIDQKFFKKMGFTFLKGCFKYERASMECQNMPNIYLFGLISCQFCPITRQIKDKLIKDNGLASITNLINNIKRKFTISPSSDL